MPQVPSSEEPPATPATPPKLDLVAQQQTVQVEVNQEASIPIPVSDVDLHLPEMETFEVELVKDQQGLGITIAGYVCEKGKKEGG